MDAPTVRIIERILQDQSRMLGEYRQLLEELPKVEPADPRWVTRLRDMESSIDDFVVHRSVAKSAKAAG
jgi:hypothetical protein